MGKSNILSWRLDHNTGSHENKDIVLIKVKFLAIQVLEDVVIEDKKRTLLRDIY